MGILFPILAFFLLSRASCHWFIFPFGWDVKVPGLLRVISIRESPGAVGGRKKGRVGGKEWGRKLWVWLTCGVTNHKSLRTSRSSYRSLQSSISWHHGYFLSYHSIIIRDETTVCFHEHCPSIASGSETSRAQPEALVRGLINTK